eukprot:sb/3462445/
MFTLVLFLLLRFTSAEDSPSFICPKGVKRLAADSSLGPDKYWQCEREGEEPVLKSCPEGKYYHRRSARCRTIAGDGGPLKSSEKKSVREFDLLEMENTERGSKLLGQLYNARTGTFIPGMFLWSQHTTVKNAQIVQPQLYSNLEIFQEQDVDDRAFHLNLQGDLKLSLLSDLVSVSGTAQYLKDEKRESEKARVVMNFRSTRQSETMPITTPISNRMFCNFATRPDGPTHAVTSRLIGLRAFLRFDLDVKSEESTDRVAGKLEAHINAIPGFKVAGSAWVDIEGHEVENIDNLSVRYYGDAAINNPTSYLAAVEAFNDIQRKALDSNAVVRYQLTPLSYLCTQNVKKVAEIQDSLVTAATTILVELDKTRTQTSILLHSNVAGLIPTIKRVLNTFQTKLDSFTDGLKEDIQNELKILRSGGSELGLMTAIQRYQDSAFAYNKARLFLEVRKREISTIQLVVDAVEGDLFAMSDSDNTDIEYIVSNRYSALFVLRVLPKTNAADAFIEKHHVLDESEMWYNNLTMVGMVGSHLSEFISFARANQDQNHGFIVRVREVEPDNTMVTNVKFYRPNMGDEEQDLDFIPPPQPPRPVCKPRFDGFDIVTRETGNKFVTHHYITAESDGKQTVVEKGNSGTENVLKIRNLEPNTSYNISTKYKIYDDKQFPDAGFSAPSPVVTYNLPDLSCNLTSPHLPDLNLNLPRLLPASAHRPWSTILLPGPGKARWRERGVEDVSR